MRKSIAKYSLLTLSCLVAGVAHAENFCVAKSGALSIAAVGKRCPSGTKKVNIKALLATAAVPGPQGLQGEKGETGAQGIQGQKGDKGDAGPQGLSGATGPQGAQGLKGDTGPQGISGPIGPQGLKGDKGDTGPQGLTGLTGPMGPQGMQGLKGDKGDIGLQGLTGQRGPQGIQGPKGDKGDTGAKGDQGTSAFFPPSDLTSGIAKFMTIKLNGPLSAPVLSDRVIVPGAPISSTTTFPYAAFVPCGKWFITRVSCQSAASPLPSSATISRVKPFGTFSYGNSEMYGKLGWARLDIASLPIEAILTNTAAAPVLGVLNDSFTTPMYFDLITSSTTLITVPDISNSSYKISTMCGANGSALGNARVKADLIANGNITDTRYFDQEILSSNMPCDIDLVTYQN